MRALWRGNRTRVTRPAREERLGSSLDRCSARLLDFVLIREYPGGITLRRTGKTRQPVQPLTVGLTPSEHHSEDRDPADLNLVNRRRREFLVRCCQGVSAAVLVPAGLRGFAFPFIFDSRNTPLSAGDVDFHLHPRYRSETPLDAALLKTQAGLDGFITEKYHDQIAAILAEWSSSLLQSPVDARAVAKSLALDFLGSSFRPVESRLVRSGPALEIRQNKFTSLSALGGEAFLQELQSAMSSFSKIITAEFQVVSI